MIFGSAHGWWARGAVVEQVQIARLGPLKHGIWPEHDEDTITCEYKDIIML